MIPSSQLDSHVHIWAQEWYKQCLGDRHQFFRIQPIVHDSGGQGDVYNKLKEQLDKTKW